MSVLLSHRSYFLRLPTHHRAIVARGITRNQRDAQIDVQQHHSAVSKPAILASTQDRFHHNWSFCSRHLASRLFVCSPKRSSRRFRFRGIRKTKYSRTTHLFSRSPLSLANSDISIVIFHISSSRMLYLMVDRRHPTLPRMGKLPRTSPVCLPVGYHPERGLAAGKLCSYQGPQGPSQIPLRY